MPERKLIGPKQEKTRSTLRMAGWACLVLGVILIITGAMRMFSPAVNHTEDKPTRSNRQRVDTDGFMNGTVSFNEVQRQMDQSFEEKSSSMDREFSQTASTMFSGFGIAAVGMVLASAGGVMLKMGYMGAVGRYIAGEAAPVVADTVNYMGKTAGPGIRAVGDAFFGRDSAPVSSAPTESAAASPGQPTSAAAGFCTQCGTPYDTDDRFCAKCGSNLLS